MECSSAVWGALSLAKQLPRAGSEQRAPGFPTSPGHHCKHGWGCLPSPVAPQAQIPWGNLSPCMGKDLPAPFPLSMGAQGRAGCQGLALCTQVILDTNQD